MVWVLGAVAGRAWGGCDGGVVINELFADPPSTNAGAEWVELVGCGDAPVDLSGWRLAAGTSAYGAPAAIPAGTRLAPGEHLVIGQSAGPEVDVVTSGFTLGNAGTSADAVQLRDPADRPIDTVVYGPINSDGWFDDRGAEADSLGPAPGAGESVARVPDAADTDASGVDFALAAPSPGRANDLPVEPCGGPGSGVVINELLPDPDGTDAGAEWVEILNAGRGRVEVTGWRLEAGTSSYAVQATFDGILAPGERRLVDGATLTLGNAGTSADAVRLVDCAGLVVDTVVYGASNPDGWGDDAADPATTLAPAPGSGQSLARRVDGRDTDDNAGDFVVADTPTPGEPNPDATPPICEAGEVRINEIVPDPDGTDDGAEWIELVSLDARDRSLGGWTIRARTSLGDADDVVLAADVVLPAAGLVAIGGPAVEPPLPWVAELAFGNGTDTDAIELVDCAGAVVDTVLYGEAPNDDQLVDDRGEVAAPYGDPIAGAALARAVDGVDTDEAGDWRVTQRPTPGLSNEAAPLDAGPVACTAGPSAGCSVVALQPALLAAGLAAAAMRERRATVRRGGSRAHHPAAERRL